MADIKPFNISVPETRLEDLKKRLELASFPDELDDQGWIYGSPVADVRRIVEHWKTKFDWGAQEAKLNELPQYTIELPVEGFDKLNVHFIHHKSPAKHAIPLLFIHGWPGSFIEVTKILPLLKASSEGGPAFSIVAPSLPNFGFSSRIKKKGFGLLQYAECLDKLMHKLGYPEYVCQAGDWGTAISRALAYKFPKSCKAYHLNTLPGRPPQFKAAPFQAIKYLVTPYTAKEKAGMQRTMETFNEGTGYFKEQSTKPATLGFGLNDSPVALLAWIYEKLHDWTDAYPWTEDEVLTWISIYWFSEAGPSASTIIYYEVMHDKAFPISTLGGWIPGPKIGILHTPKEMYPVPKSWGRCLGPVVYESESDRGGHFAAWEIPEVVVRDVKAMYGKGGAAFGLVKGRSGYDTASSRL